jgi:two-component system alkaline phosphatase synthesis response regulator PhoP
MRELIARVKAQLRRSEILRIEFDRVTALKPEEDHKTLIFGNLAIDQTRREVKLDNHVIALKPQEYDLLLFFAEHKGKMLSREFILERVWGWEFIGDSRTVDVHVRWLRQKIEKDAANPERIVTVRGGGYRFEG